MLLVVPSDRPVKESLLSRGRAASFCPPSRSVAIATDASSFQLEFSVIDAVEDEGLFSVPRLHWGARNGIIKIWTRIILASFRPREELTRNLPMTDLFDKVESGCFTAFVEGSGYRYH